MFIDEYQKAPIVLDAIKAEFNRDTRPGRFALAGSARHDALPPAAQALTGRLTRLTVYPLSQGEINGFHEDLIERRFANPSAAVASRPRSDTPRTPRDLRCRRDHQAGLLVGRHHRRGPLAYP